MADIIPINWYTESPIDFEHKQYVLLSYLQIVDDQFILKKLSPHLLHMESMVKEMNFFKNSLFEMKYTFDKNRYVYLFNDNPKLEGEDNSLLNEVIDIVEFSIPLVQSRINLGHFILGRSKQVLF